MIIYSKEVQLLKESFNSIEFSISDTDEVYHIGENLTISNNPVQIGVSEMEDQVLLKTKLTGLDVIVYIKSSDIFVTAFDVPKPGSFSPKENSLKMDVVKYSDVLSLEQTGNVSFSVYGTESGHLFTLHDLATDLDSNFTYPIDLHMKTVEYRFFVLSKIVYKQYNYFLIYDLFKKEISSKKVTFTVDSNEAGLEFNLFSPNLLEVSFNEENKVLNFKSIENKSKKVFEFYELTSLRNLHMLGTLKFNHVKYFIHNKSGGVYITKSNGAKATGYKSYLKSAFFGKNLFIYGRNTHYAYNANGKYEFLHISEKGRPISKFKRPLNFRFFRRFGYFKIAVNDITGSDEQVLKFQMGDATNPIHALKVKPGRQKPKILSLKKFSKQVNLIRKNSYGNLSSITSYEPNEFTLKKRLANWIKDLKNRQEILRLFRKTFIILGKLPKKKNLVIFESFHAKQYSDSPRAIYEYMKENHSGYKLLWSIDKSVKNLFDEFKVPYIERFSIRWFLTFPRAKYWVNNVRLPGWMPKPQNTIYVQTWHGTPLKKLGIDIDEIHMPGTSTAKYKRNFVNEANKWDYLVSPNEYSTEIFTRAFHYSGEVIESGYPRNDVLTNHTSIILSNLKKKLGIPEEKKVMLYAPTWRDNEFHQKGKYKFEFQFNLENWKKEFGDEWVLLSRMHYLVAENFDFTAHAGTVYDVSTYPDIRDLYLISDLLITDYSSVFFDYAILNRPIVFFMYDLENYRDQLRGFYIDIENEAPGPIVQTEAGLFAAINELKDTDPRNNPNFKAFRNRFSSLEDGHAAQRVVEAFLE